MHAHSFYLLAPGEMAWVKEELPALRPDEVLVQTTAGAISIGTELPKFRGTSRGGHSAHYPQMTGYESVGRIVACGSAVKRLKIGDRVVGFYGHRTYGIMPAAKAIAVPPDISEAVALLAILSCDVTKGIRKLQPRAEEAILITGAGTIGLLTIFMLKAHGLQTIDVIEPLAERTALALAFGADSAGPTAGKREGGYNVGIECSSHNAAFETLQEHMATGGRICVLADGNIEPLTLSPAFHEKELMVAGSSDGWNYQEHARLFFPLARTKHELLEQLYGYKTQPDDLRETFRRLARKEITPIKVLVQYRNEVIVPARQALPAS
jgi:alcohol dehydrogenase